MTETSFARVESEGHGARNSPAILATREGHRNSRGKTRSVGGVTRSLKINWQSRRQVQIAEFPRVHRECRPRSFAE
jgi:hypothetical protein